MYTEFYGLSEKPFELTPDPKFLYITPSYQKVLASIAGGIKTRKRFLSITGEVGTGKTTLVHSLLKSLDEKVKSVFIFHTTVTFKDLLRIILQELGLVVTRKSTADLLNQLIEHLTQITARGEGVAIIIDEAQNLPPKVLEEIQMFCDFQTRLAQFILVGQPELEDILNSEALRQLQQSIEIRCQLKALTEEESKDYIDHRLRLVGSSSSQTFTPKAISMICSYAQGIPRIINILCDNAFLTGYSLSHKKIDVDIIREVIKDMKGLFLQQTILSSVVTKDFRLFPPRLNFLLSKAALITLSFLCLGGFVILTDHYFQPRPAKTWDIKSLKSPGVDTKASPTQPSSQKIMEDISKPDSRQPPGESDPVASMPPQLVSPPPASLASIGEEEKLKEMVTIKKGHTIYSLARKYYRTVNETFMDLILDSNPEITDLHLIMVDQKIVIPAVTEKLLVIKSADNAYKIHAGTFRTPRFARLYRDERALEGKKVEMLPRKVSPQDTWYRVVIEKFNSEDEVLRMIGLLKEKGLLPAFGGAPKIE